MLANIVFCALGMIAAGALAVLHRRCSIAGVWALCVLSFGFLMWDCFGSPAFPWSLGIFGLMSAMFAALLQELGMGHPRTGRRSPESHSKGE